MNHLEEEIKQLNATNDNYKAQVNQKQKTMEQLDTKIKEKLKQSEQWTNDQIEKQSELNMKAKEREQYKIKKQNLEDEIHLVQDMLAELKSQKKEK